MRPGDDEADERALPIGIDASEQKRVAHDFDERRADHRRIGNAVAAHEIGAADDRRGDDLELVADAEPVGHGAEPPDHENGGDSGREAADDVDGNLDRHDGNARQQRRLLVAADRVDVAAPARVGQNDREDDCDQRHRDDDRGDAEQTAAAELAEKLLVRTELIDHLVVGQDQRLAARDRQHDQRHDERRQLEPGDRVTVDEAADERDPHPRADPDPQRISGLKREPGHDADEAHHRADRQIDAARDDHQHLAHAHDGDEPEVAAVVVEIVVAAERLRDQRHHDANDENRERDRRGLTKPHDPEATRGRRSEFSLRGHGRALSYAEPDRNSQSMRVRRIEGSPPRRAISHPSPRRRLHMNVPPDRPRVCGRRRSTRFDNRQEQRLVTDQLHCQARTPTSRRLRAIASIRQARESRYRRSRKASKPREGSYALGDRSAAHRGLALRFATDGTRRRDRCRRRQFPRGLRPQCPP